MIFKKYLKNKKSWKIYKKWETLQVKSSTSSMYCFVKQLVKTA